MQTKKSNYAGNKLNKGLAERVIQMHQMGYVLDFYENRFGLVCTQTGLRFPWGDLDIRQIDHKSRAANPPAVRIFSVETSGGFRGLLLSKTNRDLSNHQKYNTTIAAAVITSGSQYAVIKASS